MTVEATATSVSYSPGDAMAPQSLAALHFLDSADLVVTHQADDDGTLTVLAEGDDYTIGGDGTAGTGTITATAEYPAGDQFHVERRTAALQPAELTAFEDLPAAAIEASLDRAVLIAAEARDLSERGLLVPLGETAPALLPVADRAGSYLAFDAEGGIVAASGTGADEDLRADLAASTGAGLIGLATGISLAAFIAAYTAPLYYTAGDVGDDFATFVEAMDFLKTQPLNRPVALTVTGAHAIPITGYKFDHPKSRNLSIIGADFVGVVSNAAMTSVEATDKAYINGRYGARLDVAGNGTDDISGSYGLAFPHGFGSITNLLFNGNGHIRYLVDLGYNGAHAAATGNSGGIFENCAFVDSVWGILAYGAQVTLKGQNYFGYQISGGPIGLFGGSTLENDTSITHFFTPTVAAYALSPKYVIYCDASTLYMDANGFGTKCYAKGQFLHGIYMHNGSRGVAMSFNFDGVSQPFTLGYDCSLKAGTPNIDNADPTKTALTLGGGQPGIPGNEGQGALMSSGCGSKLMCNGATIDDCVAPYYVLLQGGNFYGYGTVAVDGSKATTNAFQVTASKGNVASVVITNPLVGAVDQCLAQHNGDIFFYIRTGMTVSPALNTPTQGSGNYGV